MIGTNKKDAAETVELLLEDAAAGLLAHDPTTRISRSCSRERGVDFVEYAGWEAIDAHERALGDRAGPAAGEARELGRRSSREPGSSDPAARLASMSETGFARSSGAAETRKAIDNFPISGEPIPIAARALARPDQGRRRARERRARAARCRQGRAHRRRRRPHRPRRARRPVPGRRLPDRLGHLVEHERERGDRDARGRRRAPERRRQHGPVDERRLPVGDPPRRARGDRLRAPAGARRARAGARGEGARVRRRDQGRPHALDGRRPDDARPGVRRLCGPGAGRPGADRGDARAPRPDSARRHRRRHGAEHAPRVRRLACARGSPPRRASTIEAPREPVRGAGRAATRSSRSRARSR